MGNYPPSFLLAMEYKVVYIETPEKDKPLYWFGPLKDGTGRWADILGYWDGVTFRNPDGSLCSFYPKHYRYADEKLITEFHFYQWNSTDNSVKKRGRKSKT
jgi:hypothetical protein